VDEAKERRNGVSKTAFVRTLRLLERGVDGGILYRRAMAYMETRGVDVSLYEIGVSDVLPYYVCWLFKQHGELVFFQGRSFNEARTVTRTLNPPKRDGWYDKTSVVPFYDLIENGMDVVLVEGPFDAVALTNLSIGRIGIPVLGNTLSDRQLQLLSRKNPSSYTVMLDPPAKDPNIGPLVERMALKLFKSGGRVFVVNWPKDEARDPSALGRAAAARLLRECSIRYSPYGKSDQSISFALCGPKPDQSSSCSDSPRFSSGQKNTLVIESVRFNSRMHCT
jgi:hypothetical protein